MGTEPYCHDRHHHPGPGSQRCRAARSKCCQPGKGRREKRGYQDWRRPGQGHGPAGRFFQDPERIAGRPDKGIPDKVFESAKCVAVVPSMVKGGFVFGAEHGRGVATCRTASGGWSAPALFVITGGSWGAQIGVQAADVVMLIMNDQGMNELLELEVQAGRYRQRGSRSGGSRSQCFYRLEDGSGSTDLLAHAGSCLPD